MGIGTSLLLIAVGAILRFAVTDSISGIDLSTVGLILLIVGVVGLVISLILMLAPRRSETVVRRDAYHDPYADPPPRI
jgi:tellurite resistance protein TehA-like permease